MRVLHVLTSNKYSGAENVACQIIKMFDNDIEMAYCSPEGPIENSLKDKGIKFIPMNKFSLSELKRVVKEYNPDILHCHDLKASICGSLIKNKKVISHVHGNKSNMSKISLKSLVYKLACKKIDKILWVSNSCYDDFRFKEKVKNKSLIFPNIISINELELKVEEDTNQYDNFDLVYLGRLVYEKDPLRLIEIAKILKEEIRDFKFAIIGDGIFKNQMEEKIREYGLEDNITMFGFCSNPFKILEKSKLMLMTSIMEGTPMCALEAMALSVPVISTKTDGMVDLVNLDNGFL